MARFRSSGWVGGTFCVNVHLEREPKELVTREVVRRRPSSSPPYPLLLSAGRSSARIPTYDDQDVFTFSRAWTGFVWRDWRSGFEAINGFSMHNR